MTVAVAPDVRVHPDGLEKLCAIGQDADHVQCRTIAFRLSPNHPWLPATAGSLHVHTLTTWNSWRSTDA